MTRSAKRILLEPITEKLFIEGLKKLVEVNKEFIPPYSSGGSLYIRPILFGSGEGLGITVPKEFTFILFCSPVGPYYKSSSLESVSAIVLDNFDRVADRGLGSYKVAGNYAGNMLPLKKANKKGFAINLFLDPKENLYIDEFGTSNFAALKGNTYLTPKSDSILPSITNDSLSILAQDELGLSIEKGKIHINDISNFDQIFACGTAVVLTPVNKIVYKNKEVFSSSYIDKKVQTLYKLIQDIQYGKSIDKFNWCLTL